MSPIFEPDCACARLCVRSCARLCVRSCVRASMCAFVRARVYVCVRACARLCVRSCVQASILKRIPLITNRQTEMLLTITNTHGVSSAPLSPSPTSTESCPPIHIIRAHRLHQRSLARLSRQSRSYTVTYPYSTTQNIITMHREPTVYTRYRRLPTKDDIVWLYGNNINKYWA